MNKNKLSIYNISKEEAKEMPLRAKKAMDAFWKKHCANVKDPLTLTIKCHLFIESSITRILEMVVPKPSRLLKDMTFYNKVKLFEALQLAPNSVFINKLNAVNKLRNFYAHNLDKKMSKKEFTYFKNNLSLKSSNIKTEDISKVMFHVIGYLHATENIEETFPFYMNSIRNLNHFKKDKLFLVNCVLISELKPEVSRILDNSKMKL